VQQADPASTPFRGSLDLNGVGIADFQKFLQTPVLTNTDGVLSGHTNITSDSGKLSANGQMSLDKPRIRGVEVGYPITTDFDMNDDLTSGLLRINKGMVKLGQTPLYATGTVNMKPSWI